MHRNNGRKSARTSRQDSAHRAAARARADAPAQERVVQIIRPTATGHGTHITWRYGDDCDLPPPDLHPQPIINDHSRTYYAKRKREGEEESDGDIMEQPELEEDEYQVEEGEYQVEEGEYQAEEGEYQDDDEQMYDDRHEEGIEDLYLNAYEYEALCQEVQDRAASEASANEEEPMQYSDTEVDESEAEVPHTPEREESYDAGSVVQTPGKRAQRLTRQPDRIGGYQPNFWANDDSGVQQHIVRVPVAGPLRIPEEGRSSAHPGENPGRIETSRGATPGPSTRPLNMTRPGPLRRAGEVPIDVNQGVVGPNTARGVPAGPKPLEREDTEIIDPVVNHIPRESVPLHANEGESSFRFRPRSHVRSPMTARRFIQGGEAIVEIHNPDERIIAILSEARSTRATSPELTGLENIPSSLAYEDADDEDSGPSTPQAARPLTWVPTEIIEN